MTQYETKRVKSPRVADRLQREGWELVAIDHRLTVPNVFHLKREKPEKKSFVPSPEEQLEALINSAQVRVRSLKRKIYVAQRKGKVKRVEALQVKLEKAQQKLRALKERAA